MSAKLEEIAHIKASIREAVSKIERGDGQAAILALAEALSGLLVYVMAKEKDREL